MIEIVDWEKPYSLTNTYFSTIIVLFHYFLFNFNWTFSILIELLSWDKVMQIYTSCISPTVRCGKTPAHPQHCYTVTLHCNNKNSNGMRYHVVFISIHTWHLWDIPPTSSGRLAALVCCNKNNKESYCCFNSFGLIDQLQHSTRSQTRSFQYGKGGTTHCMLGFAVFLLQRRSVCWGRSPSFPFTA